MKYLLSFVITCVLVLGCEPKKIEKTDETKEVSVTNNVDPKANDVIPGNTAASRTVKKIDSEIAFAEKSYKQNPTTILAKRIIGGYGSRFRLSGDANDLVKAKGALDRALKDLNDPPTLQGTRASLLNSLHDVAGSRDAAERALKIAVNSDDKASAYALVADADFASGKLGDARDGYQRAVDLRQSAGGYIRLSTFHQKIGEWEPATDLADAAIKRGDMEGDWSHAFALLLRGTIELERGRLDKALAFYEQADDKFDGWYLIEEHIAEIYASQGKHAEAKKLYERILGRVPSGQFYAALADVEEAIGNKSKAEELRKSALEAVERDVALLPTAMGGHAFDVVMEHGDPKRALELAQANFKTKPDHEARVILAQALIANEQHDQAFEVLDPVLNSKWDTVDFHLTAAVLYDKKGDDKTASSHRASADAIRPGATKE